MEKWSLVACSSFFASLAAFIGYKIYANHAAVCARKSRRHKNYDYSGVDIEEILDDDVLEECEGCDNSISAAINSDDEFDSDVDEDKDYECKKLDKKCVDVRGGEHLKNLAKKIRANRRKLTEDDNTAKKLLQTWMQEKPEGYNDSSSSAKPNLNPVKTGKDALFYNLFACYAETASRETKV